jgi:hypothetical protein
VDFFKRVGSTLYHHDFHYDSLHPFWTDEIANHSLRTNHFPFESSLRLRNFEVVDTVTIVNADGTESPPVAEYPARVEVDVVWTVARTAQPFEIQGLTAATLLPTDVVPGGLEAVSQQPFSGRMFRATAVGSFRARAFDREHHRTISFSVDRVRSDFAEVGFEHLGAPAP